MSKNKFLTKKRSVIFLVILIPILIILFGTFFLSWISHPLSKELAATYFQKILNKDSSVTTAEKLCGGNILQDDTNRYIELYGNKQTKNVKISAGYRGGSDESLEIADINFQYLDSKSREWKDGHISLLTTYSIFGKRCIEEGLDFHSP